MSWCAWDYYTKLILPAFAAEEVQLNLKRQASRLALLLPLIGYYVGRW
jgi:hypothetical protein